MTTPTAFPVFDGHNDVLLSLYLPERGEGRSFFEESAKGHLDLPRARKGGFGGGFFAIFVPPEVRLPWQATFTQTDDGYEMQLASAIDPVYAQQTTIKMMALLFRLEVESQGQLKVVRSASEIENCLYNNILAAILHFEGAEAIDADLDALEVFYQAGLRSLGIVWSRPNIFGHGVQFAYPRTPDIGPGLTDAGKRLVKACNRLGIMIDLSHLNEQGFWDAAALSDKPLVATHSNVHALSRATRNLTDKQLDAIKASDGMVGLNFGVGDIREDGGHNADTPLEMMVRHIDYLVDHLGLDHVGFGSDFDGTTISQYIKDVSGLPNLVSALRAHGYDDDALRKLTHENWIRVLEKTWK